MRKSGRGAQRGPWTERIHVPGVAAAALNLNSSGLALPDEGKHDWDARIEPRGVAAVIQHIVLLKWKPGVTDAQIDDAFAQAQALVKEIDTVERVTLGRNRARDDHGFTHALIVKLSDDDGLSAYLDHPVRKRYVGDVLAPIEQERIEIDVPEDAHHDRPSSARRGWQWGGTRASASAAAAALRWEEQHPDSE
jgi:hypothetical protein